MSNRGERVGCIAELIKCGNTCLDGRSPEAALACLTRLRPVGAKHQQLVTDSWMGLSHAKASGHQVGEKVCALIG